MIPLEQIDRAEEEAERVEPRQEGGRDNLFDALLLESQILGTHNGRVDEVESDSIGTVLVDQQVGVWVVAERFAHLLAIGSKHETANDEVLPWRRIEEVGSQDEERVEPASGLVKTLRDEIGRERLFELLLVLEGVVSLGVGHGTRLEPAVKDLLDTLELALALLRGDGDVVNLVLVQIVDAGDTGQLFELLNGTNADDLLHVVAGPEWDGGAPVSVSRDVPVTSVGDPLAKSSLANMSRHPSSGIVVLDELLDGRLDTDEPGWDGLVDEGSAGSPAEGVLMAQGSLHNEAATGLEVLLNSLIGLFDVDTLVFGYLLGVPAGFVDWVGWGLVTGDDTVGNSNAMIVVTKGGGLVDDTGTGVRGDIGVSKNAEGTVLEALLEVGEDGLVALADKVLALERLELLELGLLGVLVESGQQAFVNDKVHIALVVVDLDVVKVGVDAKSQIGGKGPRRGGPCEKGGLGVVDEREANGDGGVLNLAVVETGLKVGERGGAGGGIGHYSNTLVDKALLMKSLEDPPDRLHEAEIHGLVAGVKVDPSSHALYGVLPLFLIGHDDSPALCIVLVDAHGHHIFLALNAELLVDLVLNGQTVAVPTESTVDIVTGRVSVSGDDILDGTCEEMAIVGKAGSEGRAVVEAEGFPALALLEGCLEGVDGAPVSDDLFLFCGKVEGCGDVVLAKRGGRVLRGSLRHDVCGRTDDAMRFQAYFTEWRMVEEKERLSCWLTRSHCRIQSVDIPLGLSLLRLHTAGSCSNQCFSEISSGLFCGPPYLHLLSRTEGRTENNVIFCPPSNKVEAPYYTTVRVERESQLVRLG